MKYGCQEPSAVSVAATAAAAQAGFLHDAENRQKHRNHDAAHDERQKNNHHRLPQRSQPVGQGKPRIILPERDQPGYLTLIGTERRLYASVRPKPVADRRSVLSVFCAKCEISGPGPSQIADDSDPDRMPGGFEFDRVENPIRTFRFGGEPFGGREQSF